MTSLNDTIREVFLAHGFTIKAGQTDLKPYVYEAVHALLSKLRAPVADERDRNDTISQIVGLCNRIPGATTWNAAQFMYDEMHRRAALASAPVVSQQCPTDVCQAAKADGVLCADDECDRANGVRPASAPVAGEAQSEGGDPASPKDDSDRTYDRPIGYVGAYELSRLNSGHDANLRSAKFGPSALDGDIPVYLEPTKADAAPQASEAVRDAATERLHALVQEAISWLETGGGRADSLCADLRKALAAQHQDGQQKYWLCCGSKDPYHSNRRAPDCFNASRAKWGTADQHSKTARAALSAQPGAQRTGGSDAE